MSLAGWAMELLEIAGLSFLGVLAYMTSVWLLSLVRRDASIVDVFWGLGFALLEKTQVRTKPQYRDYIESTSAFLPRPPRKQR